MVEQVSSREAWAALAADGEARLVDVRTAAEWQGVGVPDLRSLGKHTILASWSVYPSGMINAGFIEALREAGVRPAHRVYFLCRSGARSDAAARAAAAAGFGQVFNVADGFEGPPDATGQRGRVAGWQASQLPVASYQLPEGGG